MSWNNGPTVKGVGWSSRPTRSLAAPLATNKHSIDKKLAAVREAAAQHAAREPNA